MRLRNIPGADRVIENSEYVVNDYTAKKGKWKEFWKNDQPIYVEIGMGKGKFLMEMARQHPEINYIGVERYSSVLLRAVQKQEKDPLHNLRFIRMDAREITEGFEEGEIDRIYLNFSDPWPKDRHSHRRLTSRQFLDRFRQVLKKEGRIEFKTDNRLLFDFSVEEAEAAGWTQKAISYDLHRDEKMMEGNVMTEYEEKFSALGNPIFKYVITPK